jgi:hypothetical protein
MKLKAEKAHVRNTARHRNNKIYSCKQNLYQVLQQSNPFLNSPTKAKDITKQTQ